MSELEDFIRRNRQNFDDREPDPGHFQRFEDRLRAVDSRQRPPFNRYLVLKAAAVIIFLILASVLVFDLAIQQIKGQAVAELPPEVKEAMHYYDQQVMLQLGEIKKLANTNTEAIELSQSALQQVKILDDNTQELKTHLAENPNNGRIRDAILQNQRMKEGVLNTIVSQLTVSEK